TMDPQPIGIQLGDENKKGWLTAQSGLKRWNGENGWGYAKFELGTGANHELEITDSKHGTTTKTDVIENSTLQIDLPDERFAASLRAQVAHLTMGLVGNEARPGDPMSYPFSWLRDEAYITVALARSGQFGVARQLSQHLAENDFYG